MKSYVITIMDNAKSVKVAERCIASAERFGMPVSKFEAITPKSNLTNLMVKEKIKKSGFEERWSRMPECMSAFMSHYLLWKKSVELNEEVTIFEHDAVVMDSIPALNDYRGCISFGAPSYGKFNTPTRLGVNSLISKPYFPGAHAYRVKPNIAQLLVDQARYHARPTDVFLNTESFPFLEEYYPWPVEAHDSFTTIQNTNGIQAKHNYHKLKTKYGII
jgi:GR25 family glycosyltransferase involved in LPS biosynthesis